MRVPWEHRPTPPPPPPPIQQEEEEEEEFLFLPLVSLYVLFFK
jgi:hypothetical protein